MIRSGSATWRVGTAWHHYDTVVPDSDESDHGGCRGCGNATAEGFADLCRGCIDLLDRRRPRLWPEDSDAPYPTIAQLIAAREIAAQGIAAPTSFNAADFERWRDGQMRRVAEAFSIPLSLILGHS